jgi:hypothetical protein
MCACFNWLRLFRVLVLAGMTTVSVGWAGEQRDSTLPAAGEPAKPIASAEGRDLFAPPKGGVAADPFAPPRAVDGADPFGALTRPLDPVQQRRMKIDQLLQRANVVVQTSLENAAQDAVVLDDALMLLHGGMRDRSDAGMVLAKLAKHRWLRTRGESAGDAVERLDRQAQGLIRRTNALLNRTRQQLAALDADVWPFDWRTRREVWLELIELIIATRGGEDTSDRWRRAAAMQNDLAALYRIAHLLAVRETPSGKLDFEFVKPLFDTPQADKSDVRWAAETLTTLLVTSSGTCDPARLETRDRLLAALRDEHRIGHSPITYLSLSGLYLAVEPTRAPEGGLLLHTIATHWSPQNFASFAARAGIPANVQQELLLAKPVKVTADSDHLAAVLNSLVRQTVVPLWIERGVLEHAAKLPAIAAEGPWLSVLGQVLSTTPYRTHQLAADLFWIGQPERLESVRQTYRNNLDRIRWANPNVAAALVDTTRLGFIETPLDQIISFLKDLHSLNIELLGANETPVTIEPPGVPLHIALTELTEPLQYDWFPDHGIIFIGPADRVARVKQHALGRAQRWASLGIEPTAATQALRSETRLEFIETPLAQVVGFLSDMHKVQIRVPEARGEDRLSLDLRGISLEQALDVICWRLGLKWDTDGQTIELRKTMAEPPGDGP